MLLSFKDADVEAFDWKDEGKVTPVRDQGGCGSCWTFSTTAALESHYMINFDIDAREQDIDMSQQELLDCAYGPYYDNYGCMGGLPSHAFMYIRHRGLSISEDYPYNGKDIAKGNKCELDTTVRTVFSAGPYNITAGDEVQMKNAMYGHGPMAVAYQVYDDFRFYKKGVYTSTGCKNGEMDVNHAVLATGFGYDEESGLDFWNIKNSWGAKWGDEGYFKIERGVNMCGIGICNSFPLDVKRV